MAAVLIITSTRLAAFGQASRGLMKPVIEYMRTHPLAQSRLITRMEGLATASAVAPTPIKGLDMPLDPSAAAPVPLAPAVSPQEASIDSLLHVLAHKPELIEDHRAELSGLFGPHLSGLESAIRSGAFKLEEGYDSDASLLALRDRLAKTFDQQDAAPAEPVPAGATLASQLGGKDVVTPRGTLRMRLAVFPTGAYKPEYEQRLRESGYDAALIEYPNADEISALQEKAGWFLKTNWVRWVTPAKSERDFLDDLPQGARTRFTQTLHASKDFYVGPVPLTEKDFLAWYKIYLEETVAKPNGRQHVRADMYQKLKDNGTLKDWHGIFYRDAAGTFLGGVLIQDIPGKDWVAGRFAGYRPETRKYSASYRSFMETMKEALKQKRRLASLGADTNSYGFDNELGLMSNKSNLYLTPFPEEKLELIKVLNGRTLAQVKTPNGQQTGYYFIGPKRDSLLVKRYLAAGAPTADIETLLGGYFTPGQEKPGDMLQGVFHSPDKAVKRDAKPSFGTPRGITTLSVPLPD